VTDAVVSELDPALVSPVVPYSSHVDCPVTGEIYTAGRGQVASFFIGRTRGFYHPRVLMIIFSECVPCTGHDTSTAIEIRRSARPSRW
jgi:hypothetical protein